MLSRMVRRAECYAGLAALAAIPCAASAQTVETGVTVSGGLSAETNPYNDIDGRSSAAATAEVRPSLRYRDEYMTVDVNALAQFRQFFRDYGLEDNYGVDANLVSRQSEQVTLRGSAAYSYTEGGFGGFGRPSTGAGAPVVIGPDFTLPDTSPLLTDVTILGQRTRVSSSQVGLGVDARLSPRSQVSLDGYARTMRFDETTTAGIGPFSDYNAVTGEAQYRRTLNEFTSAGIIGSYSHSDFLGTRIGDSDVVSALLSLDTRVGARWTVTGAVGASFTSLQQAAGQPDVNFTSLNVRLRACSVGEVSQFCLNAQRSPQPAANGDVRISDSIGADYQRQLDDKQQITLAVNYARTGRGRLLTTQAQPALDFVSASARYDYRFAKNMTFFTSASYAKIYGATIPRRGNAGAAVGIQASFGALR